MSVTAFAEHLGAARRTVAKWSSRATSVIPRADMQAALDTVLTRATPEVRERFAALRATGTNGAAASTTPPHPAQMPILVRTATTARTRMVTCNGETSCAALRSASLLPPASGRC